MVQTRCAPSWSPQRATRHGERALTSRLSPPAPGCGHEHDVACPSGCYTDVFFLTSPRLRLHPTRSRRRSR
eukprot:6201059-Pyramimonas_sp.AAC.1